MTYTRCSDNQHNFLVAHTKENTPALFCTKCGEIRQFTAPKQEEPANVSA